MYQDIEVMSPYRPSAVRNKSINGSQVSHKFNPSIRIRASKTLSSEIPSSLILKKMRTQSNPEERTISMNKLPTEADTSTTVVLPALTTVTMTYESTEPTTLQNQICTLIQEENRLEHLIKIIGTENQYYVACRQFVFREIPSFSIIKDSKLAMCHQLLATEATVAILVVMMLRQKNKQSLRLLVPALKNILISYDEMLLYLLELSEEECHFAKFLVNRMMDISRLLEMREYDRDSRRKGKLIAQAYKLKDTLTQIIKKETNDLGCLEGVYPSFSMKTSMIIDRVAADPRYSGLLIPIRRTRAKSIAKNEQKPTEKQYTLFVELENTLVSGMQYETHATMRPYGMILLKELAKAYNIVVFSEGGQKEVNSVLAKLNIQRLIDRRMYHQNTESITKAISPAKSILLRSYSKDSQISGPSIRLIQWYGEKSDRVLRDVFPILRLLSLKGGNNLQEEIETLAKCRKYSLLKHGFQLLI